MLGTAAFLIACGTKAQREMALPPEPTSTLSVPEAITTDKANFERNLLEAPDLDMCFEFPVCGAISSYFSVEHPLGIDIDTYNNPNPQVKAASSGKVIFSGGDACCSYGLHVVLEHEQEAFTLYAHMSTLGVMEGDKVTTGQAIGVVGNTGYSTSEHLHFEIMKAKDGQLEEARRILVQTPNAENEIVTSPLYYYNPLVYLRNGGNEICSLQ